MSKFTDDLRLRIVENKPTRWVRFGIVSIIFFAWVAWLGNWWFALFYLLLFDIYITGYIPFTWWKRSKSKFVRTVMSWVDAIVYALVLVYFIFAFVGQNYMIPTSSLEKTLLVGDYLWVNKMVYGPRVPITPIHFPLVHNKLPILNSKSYTDWPQNEYHRLKGVRDVEAMDIVVFNFPAGDTVATRTEEAGSPIYGQYYDQLVARFGKEAVNTNHAMFGDIVYRPVDRRENYVKRCVGLPGQRLRISNDTIYIDGVAQQVPHNVQYNYVLALSAPISNDLAENMGLTPTDCQMIMDEKAQQYFINVLGIDKPAYLFYMPLSADMLQQLKDNNLLMAYAKINDIPNASMTAGYMYPSGLGDSWTVSNWGGPNGVLIPRKGMTIRINEAAWQLYNRCIRNYEGHHDAYFKDGVMYMDGKPTDTYTFGMDYYFMMGDNRDNSLDSRFWGFVPEDHIVGTPMIVLASFDQERGGLRTNRIFRDANPDK